MSELSREPNARTLAAFLSGECSPSEADDVTRWAQSSTDNAARLEALRAAWNTDVSGTAGADASWSAEEMWRSIESRLGDERRRPLELVPNRPRRTPSFGVARRRNFSAWVTAAACGILLTGVWAGQRVSTDRARRRPHVPPPPREYRTDRGQRASVTLPDGSAFQLGPMSVLRVPATYGVPERAVELEGDGYFNVTHDATHPFSVRTARTTIRDVGTRFIVRARPSEQRTEIAVAEGRVTIEPVMPASDGGGGVATRDSGQQPTLGAGQAALVDERGAVTLLTHASIDARFAWTRGEFVFDHVLVPNVLAELSRWYGNTFVLADRGLDTVRLTTTLRGETLLEALVVLETALDVHARVQGDTVTLTRHIKNGR